MLMGAFEVEFFGGLMTFDAVTVYGVLCATVFLTGFRIAINHDKRRTAQLTAHKN